MSVIGEYKCDFCPASEKATGNGSYGRPEGWCEFRITIEPGYKTATLHVCPACQMPDETSEDFRHRAQRTAFGLIKRRFFR